ncbi:pheromone-processing carboxypeptidase KEX1-like [Asparagus officinalis]|uniref:pheromone-processing carboxypeptidase KEX1-like n=1 Tax=Asparagus officinalis TaxID=4686 RepID=UPI00098E7375|nr:pheromone-processing carboxypeptidase KEX1-like [Asparagus officinalis]XP_020267313.1 pheromone-processing carboxypeptidase KEX1-like [Asparagus officinalis]
MNNSKKKTEALDGSSSEVDDLLRAAEDHLLLDLRLNSHSKSQIPFTSSSSSLDSDLARRFDALKSPSSSDPSFTPLKKPSPSEGELSGILGDDLDARFAALKGSVGAAAAAAPDLGLAGVSDGGKFYEESDDGDDDGGRDGDGVSKKEVEKLLQWAKDAARLDPSSKDDDDEIDDDDVSEDNDDDSDDSEQERINEKKMKSKGKPNRFIFF